MRAVPRSAVRAVRLALALALSPVGVALAQEPAAVESALPRDYSGEFAWAGDPTPQRVDITINLIAERGKHEVDAVGCGRYVVVGQVTSIGVRMQIDVPTLSVEIFEFAPIGRGAETFTVDGSHKGRLSEDLKTIEAEWTTLSTGQKGSLRLRAGAGEVACDGAVAALP